MALHRGDAQAARRELVSAQHPRRLLTYALPHLAVQARIELIRAHLALADLAGARTLMREVDDLLRRRPGLGNLVAEAETLRTMLATARGWGSAWPEHRPWMPGPSRCFKSGRRWPSGRRHPAWNGAPAARWRRARPRRRSPTCCWRSPRWSAWAGSSPRWRSPGRGSWAYSKDGDPPSCKAIGWTACRNTTRGSACRPLGLLIKDKRYPFSHVRCICNIICIESYENNRCTFICTVHLEDASPTRHHVACAFCSRETYSSGSMCDTLSRLRAACGIARLPQFLANYPLMS